METALLLYRSRFPCRRLRVRESYRLVVGLRGNLGGDTCPTIAGIGFVLADSQTGALPAWCNMRGSFHNSLSPVPRSLSKNSHLSRYSSTVDGKRRPSRGHFFHRPSTHVLLRRPHFRALDRKQGQRFSTVRFWSSARLGRLTETTTSPDGTEPDEVLPEPPLLPTENNDATLEAGEQWLLVAGSMTPLRKGEFPIVAVSR